jgi:sigma-B regulation protein RsbU (phosphoserine phosphatase)
MHAFKPPIQSAEEMAAMSRMDLSQYPLFKDFSPAQTQEILSFSTILQINPDEVLIESGKSNDTLYLLIKGELNIILENKGTEVAIPVTSGECLGEMSLVMEQPTSAKVLAHTTCRVLCIPDHVFWDKIMIRKGVRNMMSMMASRLRRTNHALLREVEEQIQYKHLEKELETAGKIQSSMVPNGSKLLPNRPSIDAYAMTKQAREVGGDFFDAIPVEEEHVYLAIGDVSGKGMPAALFMMRAFTSLRMLMSNSDNFIEVMPAVNKMLALNNDDMMFVSIFTAVLNVHTGVLRYVNGGHNPPFISLGGEKYVPLEVEKSPLVGVLEDAHFKVGQITLQPGDSMLLYTDGITEAMNAQSLMFDTDGTQAVLNTRAYSSMEELVKAVEKNVEEFVGDAPQHDDFTMLAFRYLG